MAKQWDPQLLKSLTNEQTIKVAPDYADHRALTPIIVWFVRVGNDLYVRAYRGPRSKWYQSAVKQGTGQAELDGHQLSVKFAPVDRSSFVNKTVNQEYLAKYHGNSMLWMVENALDSTLKVSPK
ncbi:DUF2255 family protein [Acetilactobacillus jinshanensis]|uniref:DUF2255 family protein n=1 Tax=Acetilactobacillus jinshanensis TaxID=1720083 RepID=UPI0013A68225|nr:DUF2255 family protein [Acetilactobacillus jinshanensis]URL61197.1 DUF2255 family protein [uncultured bacterium]